VYHKGNYSVSSSVTKELKATQEKITAIRDIGAPQKIKDIQKLTGCMAALNRFISQLGERELTFFKLLKQQDMFQWIEEVA
jgi:hypothetical protein